MARPEGRRSSFITGLAWTFIACALLGVLVTGGQLVAVNTVLPVETLRAMLRELEKSLPLPAFIGAAFEHLRELLTVLLALSLVTLAASIGLLTRRNWARLVFIVLSLVSALWHAVGAFAPLAVVFAPLTFVQAFPPELRAPAEMLLRMALWATIGSGLLFAGAFAWLAKRLAGEEIRQEFLRRDA